MRTDHEIQAAIGEIEQSLGRLTQLAESYGRRVSEEELAAQLTAAMIASAVVCALRWAGGQSNLFDSLLSNLAAASIRGRPVN